MGIYGVILILIIALAIIFIFLFMFLLCYTFPADVVQQQVGVEV